MLVNSTLLLFLIFRVFTLTLIIMKYQYNFSFLNEWLNANPEIPKGEILQALGAKSNNRFKAWARGEGPMPVISMLRLCNAFQIPLSAFFRNADAGTDAAVVPGMPTPDDILEPTQGYASNTDDRQHGERSMLNPLDVRIIPSVVPGVVTKQNDTANKQEASALTANKVGAAKEGTSQPTADSVSEASLAAIIELENKHLEQQRRLLDIIAEQQKQIANLTSILNDARRYKNTSANDGYMVADHPTHD